MTGVCPAKMARILYETLLDFKAVVDEDDFGHRRFAVTDGIAEPAPNFCAIGARYKDT
jgi:hypothetical protein